MPSKPFFQNEADFITWVRQRSPRRTAGLTLGIGDDAALVQVSPAQELILTTDMSIAGVHFLEDLHPPRAVGHRALARSLSDIAAMGGTPRFALLSLAISRHAGRAWLEGFYGGLFALARRFSVALIGGDTAVTTGPTTADVVVTGEVPRRQGLLRSGARAGDGIYVSGRLGLSALGSALAAGPASPPERWGKGGGARPSVSSTPVFAWPISLRPATAQRHDGPERRPFHRPATALRRKWRGRKAFCRPHSHAAFGRQP